MPADAPHTAADEAHDLRDRCNLCHFYFQLFNCLRYVQATAVEAAVSLFYPGARSQVEPGAAKSYCVQAMNKAVAIHQHEGWHILGNLRDSTNHCKAADSYVLMYGHVSGKIGVILDLHVPTEKAPIGHNDGVAQAAVVCNMAHSHEKVAVAEYCVMTFMVGAMDGYVFAQNVAVTNHYSRIRPFVGQVLRRGANYRARMNHIIAPNGYAT